MSGVQVFWKHYGKKEKLLIMSNFSVSYSVFYPFWEFSAIFVKFEIVICKLFSFEESKNFVVWERVNFLPYDKLLALTKLKAFAEHKFNVDKMIISVLYSVENIGGKEENAGYWHCLIFLQCFQRFFVSVSFSTMFSKVLCVRVVRTLVKG